MGRESSCMEESKDPAHRIHGWCACTTSFDNVTVFDKLNPALVDHGTSGSSWGQIFWIFDSGFIPYEPYYARRSTHHCVDGQQGFRREKVLHLILSNPRKLPVLPEPSVTLSRSRLGLYWLRLFYEITSSKAPEPLWWALAGWVQSVVKPTGWSSKNAWWTGHPTSEQRSGGTDFVGLVIIAIKISRASLHCMNISIKDVDGKLLSTEEFMGKIVSMTEAICRS